ncbi:unnamed protein product [Amoebophrya sp. A25]|nr:unnamed protein product [Amoebophrya sp. A25]|eukprot:GSA25T00003880001.1
MIARADGRLAMEAGGRHLSAFPLLNPREEEGSEVEAKSLSKGEKVKLWMADQILSYPKKRNCEGSCQGLHKRNAFRSTDTRQATGLSRTRIVKIRIDRTP